ncbi:MAG: hypothetical protein ACD_65C00345G0003 [uncultured bacterium]|nr:MAG: hypothetical protein ACD_65C00345G0003 [uncultured bacterium]KKT01815.1 MAG: php domain protein [Candidatus Peregrinibacteria bacterium GW2011_GWF2_43_17]KKT18898.1 MAG: PHP domain protein [Candidatus Peregrinibacteria bacterium GW2011_GWA2_43_8]HAU39493.1 metal-dependent phosphoesterase [Candidatus Peregrinibacteria bacterium]
MAKFDLHIHSCYSNNLYGTKLLSPPSKSMPEDIIKVAISKGINVIAVTDHDNIIGSLRTIETAKRKEYKNKIVVIPGVEVSSKDGHILAYNVYENIPKNLSAKETVKIIKEKGGVAVAAHPFNIKYSLSESRITELDNELFALEISNSHSLKNKYAQKYINKSNLTFTVGSDAHSLTEIGLCHGETETAADSIQAMLDAIKNRKISSVYTYDKNLLIRVIPGALMAFGFWKIQQSKSLFDKKVFLPYNDTICQKPFNS